ncbi:carbohydrate sulfotransferase 4 [Bombyx mori]|uniref:Sulfotransferase domain-containing protein n=1 Tax=Bombyx mori TaxID=7091 RepID=A0A8R1WHG0_BOMMO|nr:carbohydrate sulfotransferase 4 [Bombyx mori]
MWRLVKLYSICFAFCLSVLLILTRTRSAGNTNYLTPELLKNARYFLDLNNRRDAESHPIPTNRQDQTPNIEKILDRTRAKIKFELRDYNFTYSGVQRLEDLVMETNGRPLRNIIISSWRSGTTFLGEVLNAIPGNYYHFQPLLKYGHVQLKRYSQIKTALSSIKSLLNCNFQGMDGYFDYGRQHDFQFSHNTRLWDHCKHNIDLCSDSDFMSKYCKLFPFQSMKILRLRLRFVKQILNDTKLDVKVVFLTRDPRGVMQSRLHRGFCRAAPDCSNAETLCMGMTSDYMAAGRLLKRYPNRLLLLRFEELALNLNSTMQKLLKFLRLEHKQALDEYLNSHTNTEVSGVTSTFRISRDVPFRWKDTLNFEYADRIQATCKGAMKLWGYRIAHNARHMASKDFDPLEPYKVPH